MQRESLTSTSESQNSAVSAPAVVKTEAGAADFAPPAQTDEEQQIAKAIRRLQRGRPVREAALRVQQGLAPTSLLPVFAALETPVSSRWRETQVALWTLARASLLLGQEANVVAALSRVLEATASRSSMHRMSRTKWTLALSAGFSLLVGITIYNEGSSNRNGSADLWAMCFFGAILCCVILACIFVPIPYILDSIDSSRRWRIRASATRALARVAGAENVSVLASVLEDSNSAVRDEALRVLLPLLTPAHRGQLRPSVVAALCFDIEYKAENEVLKRLDALEAIGESQALKTIKHIQHYGRTERVRHRAAEVYAILEERRAQENAPKMLLRASDASHAAPDTLLRAAAETGATDPAQLLRASKGADKDEQKT